MNQEGLKYAKKVNNIDRTYLFTINAGAILSNIDEFDKALPYFNSCLKLLQTNPDSVRKALVLNNMGNLYFGSGDHENTKRVLSESIEITSIKKMSSWESDAHITLGNIALKENNYELAQKEFQISKEILKDSKDFKQLIDTDLGFAQIDYLKNNLELIKISALGALKKANNAKFYKGINTSTKLLHDISAR